MPKRPRADRAKQFMPFAALDGYLDLVHTCERVACPRVEMSEERACMLSREVLRLHKGDMVQVVYYDRDSYVCLTGLLADIDLTFRKLRVVKTTILFDDIWEIRALANDYGRAENIGA